MVRLSGTISAPVDSAFGRLVESNQGCKPVKRSIGRPSPGTIRITPMNWKPCVRPWKCSVRVLGLVTRLCRALPWERRRSKR